MNKPGLSLPLRDRRGAGHSLCHRISVGTNLGVIAFLPSPQELRCFAHKMKVPCKPPVPCDFA
jgi:hypothetical protein